MEVLLIHNDKKRFLDLLLLADEQEDMIDKYLERGDLFTLFDDGLKSVCVVTCESEGVYELKNLATDVKYQNRGYAEYLLKYIFDYYKCHARVMYVGTGNNARTLSFYARHGFSESHIIKNFFIKNYNHPIIEDGVLLTDMIYLKKIF